MVLMRVRTTKCLRNFAAVMALPSRRPHRSLSPVHTVEVADLQQTEHHVEQRN